MQIERDSPDDMSNRLILLECSAMALITTLNPHWTPVALQLLLTVAQTSCNKVHSIPNVHNNNISSLRPRQKYTQREKKVWNS